MSATNLATPIRAIPSSLAPRTAPTLPPSSETYEPHVRSVLQQRLLHRIFLPSAGLTWFLSWLSIIQLLDGGNGVGVWGAFKELFRPSTISIAAVTWLMGVVPVVVLRKRVMTAQPTVSSSPYRTLKAALSRPTTTRALLTYLASATLQTVLHIILCYAIPLSTYGADDPYLRVFVKSRKHPYYLNGRFIFLFFSQLYFAAAYLLRNLMLDRFVAHWAPRNSPAKGAPTLSTRLFVTLLPTLLFTTLSYAVYLTGFVVLRSIIFPIVYRVPLVNSVLKPFTAHWARGEWIGTLALREFGSLFGGGHGIVRMTWLWAVGMIGCWEFVDNLMDECVQEIIIAPVTPATLISTLPATTTIPTTPPLAAYYSLHAMTQLSALASEDSPSASAVRAKDIFKFTGVGAGLGRRGGEEVDVWGTLCRESLRVLGEDYQRLKRRGAPPPAPAPPAEPAKPTSTVPPPPSTPLIRRPIFKSSASPSPNPVASSSQSPLKSVVDSFAADGTITQAFESGVQTIHLPELFRASVNTLTAPVKDVVAKIDTLPAPPPIESDGSLGQELAKWGHGLAAGLRDGMGAGAGDIPVTMPRGVKEARDRVADWWSGDRVDKIAEGVLSNERRELDASIADVLSHLVCKSLSEDSYGVVQRDIPRILEAFLAFLSAVEEYQVELRGLMPPPSSEDTDVLERERSERKREQVERASIAMGVVGDALKEGVIRIVRTFGGKLSAFKFPMGTARKLQGFVDYCA